MLKINYSSGFAIVNNRVAMIRKNRPSWQAGLLNAIGGKAEAGETPVQTVIREFWEETGYSTTEANWQLFCILHGPDFVLHFFVSYNIPLDQLSSTTDEQVEIVELASLNPSNSLPNISWLAPMAATIHLDRADYFTVIEQTTLTHTRLL